ncbi:DUF3131 domain-containing protein [Desulfonema ishimotonii]|uniref:DUF3131 domain-containing protein n=1 Tax=Desulfonema ishimotonii TaxID=45657 RepID=A0A401FUJ2_9BACT|nr:DUF3131 domain-containing protein [Desulfonema ishimotonii]GBC60642.1 DUF3131 domain-containing protein [Desulfonema ishimotonii]
MKPNLLLRLIAPLLCLILLSGCGLIVRGVGEGVTGFRNSEIFNQGRHGRLSETETAWAKIAWRYFENNYNPETGLVNSLHQRPSASMWHVADTLAGLVAAHELKLISPCDFDARMSALLHFLNTMPLFYGKLPNKLYHTRSGKMITYANKPGNIGWSAIDLGRLLTWLKIVKTRYPRYAEYADHAVLRWQFCDVIDDCGTLYGGARTKDGKSIRTFQEGRLGYEEYAARGFRLWGFDTTMSSRLDPYETVKIYGYEIPYDRRDKRQGGTVAPVLSTSFILDGMEFNWDRAEDNYPGLDSIHTDSVIADIAETIYRVQETRFYQEHIFTARTDHRLPEKPFFVYGTVFAEGYPWNVIAPDGTWHKNAALLASKAAFGMWALWKTPYTDQLMTVVRCLNTPEKGWYEGRRERTGGYLKVLTIGTNALVLESLLYKVKGKLFPGNARPGYYEYFTENPFNRKGKCSAAEREPCARNDNDKETR